MIFPVPPAVGTVKCVEIAWPSDEIPLTITCRSLPSSEKVTVCSFGGIPVLYLVLAEFSFHVPTKGSAAIDRPANARSTNTSLLYRMEVSFGAVSYHTPPTMWPSPGHSLSSRRSPDMPAHSPREGSLPS